ncbi:MAG: SIMPL domain-containing protein [Victivallaceae bacterium]|nr:SIMPL domain-containing protein [Victivallaceae bacterium]
MQETTKRTLTVVSASVIIGLAVVGAALCISRFMLNIQRVSEKTIVVKGVATKEINSDMGSISFTVRCKGKNITETFEQLKKTDEIVKAKLDEIGATAEELSSGGVNHTQETKVVTTKVNGTETSRSEQGHYTYMKSYYMRSKDVAKLAKAETELFALAAQGIDIEVCHPQYYIENPEKYKLELLDEATKAARTRAESMTAHCGAKLGQLIEARQGIIQIMKPASESTSDYGTYDTDSIPKVMRLVVTLQFRIE